MPNLFGVIGNAVNGLLYPVCCKLVGTASVSLDAVAGVTVDPALYDATNKALQVSIVAGGAGGGPVTIADGSDVTQGAKADPAATDSTSSWSVVALLKGLYALLAAGVGITGSVTANAGTNLNTSSLALEAGGHLSSIDTKLPAQGQALAAASVPVVLTAAQVSTLTPPTTVTTTPPSNASTNVAQIAGAAATVNAGTCAAGTPRVVQATAAVLNTTQASVLVTSTTVIAANANRIKVRIIQTTVNPFWIGPTSPATVGNGEYVPGIPGYPITFRFPGALYAIATGGTALATVGEESAV